MAENLREQYEKAQQLGKPAFIERPYFGSPGAPAQAETNASQIWGHINAGYLIAYEYTRWWKESLALRNAAVLGDWSWLNKTRVRGAEAARFMNYVAVKDLSKQSVGQIVYTPMASADGKVAIEGLTLKLAEDEYLFTQSAGLKWLEFLRQRTGMKVELQDVTPDYTCFALQGPRATEVLEALTGESWKDLRFSRFRRTSFFDSETLVARQGVTGEIGYEFLMRTERTLELFRREARKQPRVLTVALHPHLMGVPHRFGSLEKILDLLMNTPEVSFMTGSQIADWYRGQGGAY